MGIEAPSEYGGADCSFTTTVLAIEELSKVDPSVSALFAIHNTLCVGLLMKLGTKEQKDKYLPILISEGVFLLYLLN